MNSKGKNPILNHDDSVDIDEMLMLHMKHSLMMSKEVGPPVLAAEEGWSSAPSVQRQGGVNAGQNDTSALYLKGPYDGPSVDNLKDKRISFGLKRDLSFSFSGMNMSGPNDMLDDDQIAVKERFYLEQFVNSIIDETLPPKLPNPISPNPSYNISSSSSSSNARPGAPVYQDANAINLQDFSPGAPVYQDASAINISSSSSSNVRPGAPVYQDASALHLQNFSPGAPVYQDASAINISSSSSSSYVRPGAPVYQDASAINLQNFSPGAPVYQDASTIHLQNFIIAQNYMLQQAYICNLQQAALLRARGNIEAFGNPNMALLPANPAIPLPQQTSLLGRSPVLNQHYIGMSAHRPAMRSPVRIPEGSNVAESPNRSIVPLGDGVRGPRNPNVINNMSTDQLIAELRQCNNSQMFELVNVAGHLVRLSQDHFGSRFIQQKLETANPEEKDMAFREIIPHALTLMSDMFGNYVIQQFFEYGSTQQQCELVNLMAGRVYKFSLDLYSCRVLQKAIETVEVDHKVKLARELKGCVITCIQHKNANHVIQKLIQNVPEYAIQFIISPILERVLLLCTHEYGCRVIQRLMEHCQSQKTQMIIIDEIVEHVTELANDLYGNYVLQLLLNHGSPQLRSAMIKNFTGQIVHMSTQKYSSNVIEKCVTYSTHEELQNIVDEILAFPDGTDAFQIMMTDRYANYVVQRVLETCNAQQLDEILSRIKIHMSALQSYRYGKHILARLGHLLTTGERRVNFLTNA